MHFLVDRKHGRNYDQEGGSTAAIQMTDQGDQGCHNGYTDDIIANVFHQLVDDDIKHTGIRHDTEEQNGEYKQCCGRACALKAALDQIADLLDGIVSARYQDQSQDGRKDDKCHTRHGFTLEQCYY